nr:hypothetical protein [Tanacetum cinerariifolium]
MVDERHKEIQKASTSKGAKSPINDDESSSGSEGLNYRGFAKEKTKALRSMTNKQVGKVIKNVMPFYISQTTDNLKEVIRKELEELKKGGTMNDSRNVMETYRDFTACDVPKFMGRLTRLLVLNGCPRLMVLSALVVVKRRTKLTLPQTSFVIVLKCGGKEKICEKGEEWIGTCTWKEFKEMFTTEYAPVKKLIKFEKSSKLLPKQMRRVRLREADFLRKKNKETKRKLDFVDRDAKKTKQDQGQRSGGTQIKTPCKKCHKTHLGVCRANLSGCYKCGALNHMCKDCKKPMILCYNFNQLGHKSNECPNPKAIETKPLKSIKEEKVEKTGIPTPTARAYMMATEEDKVRNVVTGMDWLDRYNANILCSQKLVRVVNPLCREIIIYGDKRKGEFKLCSMMNARKYLSHGCQAFMAHVIDTTCEKKSVKDVPVVNEFLDVFLEDLPGIPPERQVEFRIDLIPEATPIAKTSYRLAPSEMKELMNQLQDLLDKGLIRPSSSP